jgi:hypothetical protein
VPTSTTESTTESRETAPDSREAAKLLAATAALLLILIGGFEPFYLRVFRIDRAKEEAAFAQMPYRKMTGLQTFLKGVDAHTPPGARIAIWCPFRQWEGGYGYAYYRASYLLPGKQVVPLLAPHDDHLQLANLAQADYLASFDDQIAAPGFDDNWRDQYGMLLKKR